MDIDDVMALIAVVFVTAFMAAIAFRKPARKKHQLNRVSLDKSHEPTVPQSHEKSEPDHTARYPWRTSENGNQTAVISGRRVTIYPQGNSWKYAIADPSNDDKEPYFSDAYETQQAARYEAVAHVNGTSSRYKTKRELREEKLIEALPGMLKAALEDYETVKRSVDRQNARPKLSSLNNLRKRISVKAHSAGRLYVEIAAEDKNQKDINDSKALWERYMDLQERVDAAIANLGNEKTEETQ